MRFVSPIGTLSLSAQNGFISALDFGDKETHTVSLAALRAAEQLREYFRGTRKEFSLPFAVEKLKGTAFQKSVWQALLTIPYGQTRSYKQIAEAVGKPEAVRAVAQAIGANPLGIIIPCHRVIGANGSLTGFSGGLEKKRHLLALEAGARAKAA